MVNQNCVHTEGVFISPPLTARLLNVCVRMGSARGAVEPTYFESNGRQCCRRLPTYMTGTDSILVSCATYKLLQLIGQVIKLSSTPVMCLAGYDPDRGHRYVVA